MGQHTDTKCWQQICQRDHGAGMRGLQLIQEIIFRALLHAKHNTKLASESSTSAGAVGGGSGAERPRRENPGLGFYLGQR